MKLSTKRAGEIYSAISSPIMDLRIKLEMRKMSFDELDARLFKLEQEIWEKTRKALGLEDGR